MNLFGKRYNNLNRYREVLSVFYKYGFDSYISGIGERNIVRRLIFKSRKLEYAESLSRGERLKLALEELGPTFVKLGQILSTRYDMLPKDIIESLSSLQDGVNEFSLSEAEEIFRTETGIELKSAFAHFCEKPIAAASIGQAYRARLEDGTNIVVKIQRPNIEKTINTDIDILKQMAKLLDESLNRDGIFNAKDIINEFGYYLSKEINYTYEAQNALKFSRNFKDNKKLKVPDIYWLYTTSKVLVMEEINGIKISEIDKLKQKNYNLNKVSKNLVESFMTQAFIHGFFHGDPHPGNILVIDEDTLGFIDFGIMGFVDSLTKKFIGSILKASQTRNAESVVESLLEIGSASKNINEEELKKDIYFMLNQYFDMPVEKIDFGEAIRETFKIAFKHKLKLPSQLTLLMKSIITVQGCISELEPDFSLKDISNDIIKRMTREKLSFKRSSIDFINLAYDSYETFGKLPKRINKIVENAEKNKLKLNLSFENEKKITKEIENISKRMTFAIITGALIIASAFVLSQSYFVYQRVIRYIGFITFISSFFIGNLYMWRYILKKK